jgi:hypothetical protein
MMMRMTAADPNAERRWGGTVSGCPDRWAPVVRVRAGPGGGAKPGAELVLYCAPSGTAGVPHGALLDDMLDLPTRAEIDRLAEDELSAWRDRRDATLTVDGCCLPHVYEVELFADVFLRELRVVRGIEAAFRDSPPASVRLEGLDPALAGCLVEVLRPLGIDCKLSAPGRSPSYPLTFPAARRTAAGVLRRVFGLRARVRGFVLVKPFSHLGGVYERLGGGVVLDPGHLPALRPAGLLGAAGRGGWIGHPGLASRQSSRRAVETALNAAKAERPDDPVRRLLDERALALLAQRAGETTAALKPLRSAFSKGRVRAAVVPSDATPDARLIALAAREAGRSTIQVQHGFFSLWPGARERPPAWADGMVAERVAVWSAREAAHFRPASPGEVVVTGNPGAARLVGSDLPVQPNGHVVVLVQLPGQITTKIDPRASLTHLQTALEALAAARPGADVVIRPHPFDREQEAYEALGARHGRLSVRIDASTPILQLLRGAGLCIGSTSTATLQAAASNVPTVFLNTTGVIAEWPLDGTGALPTARDSGELAQLLPRRGAGARATGRESALEALGARADALDRVMELVHAAC